MKKADFSSLKYRLDILFKNYIEVEAFTGAVLGFSFIKKSCLQRKIYCFGSVDGSEKSVDIETFFDLASLTKPFVTVLSLLSLMQEKKYHGIQSLNPCFLVIFLRIKKKYVFTISCLIVQDFLRINRILKK